MIRLAGRATRRDSGALFDLLALLKDPKAAEQRLGELHDAAEKHDLKMVEVKKAANELAQQAAQLTERETRLKQAEQKLLSEQRTHSDRVVGINAKADAIAKAESALSERQIEFKARQVVFDKQAEEAAKSQANAKADLARRAQVLTAREDQIKKREDALAAAEADYRQRLAKLKQLGAEVAA